DGSFLGCRFPLALGRQPRPRPARVSIRLVVAYVDDRSGLDERAHASQGVLEELPVRLDPVERGANPLALNEIPSVGEPQLRPLVAPVLHEREILRVRRQPIGESERLEVDAMARSFVVVRETIARESDLDDAAGAIDESDRIRLD